MGVDEHREHAGGLVVLDEAHAAHVGGEVEDLLDAVDRGPAGAELAQVEDEVLGAGVHLVPLAERLDVGRADLVAAAQQVGDQPSADESATAGDEHARYRHGGAPGIVGRCFSTASCESLTNSANGAQND